VAQLDIRNPAVPTFPKPLAEGKRVRIDKLWADPVENTVPPDFKLTMDATEEVSPHVHAEATETHVVAYGP